MAILDYFTRIWSSAHCSASWDVLNDGLRTRIQRNVVTSSSCHCHFAGPYTKCTLVSDFVLRLFNILTPFDLYSIYNGFCFFIQLTSSMGIHPTHICFLIFCSRRLYFLLYCLEINFIAFFLRFMG